MDIKVGAYSLNGNFSNKEEAKKVFLDHFPAVTEKDLDLELGKLFKDGNKSDNVTKENPSSDKQHAKTGQGSSRGK